MMNIAQHKKSLLSITAIGLVMATAYWGKLRYDAYQGVQQLKQRTLMQMVFVKGGTFMMGDVGYKNANGTHLMFSGDPDALPVHQVTLSNYSISAYETTFEDYDAYTKYVGKEIVWPHLRGDWGPKYPAMGMNWFEAREYCQWLGEQIGYAMDLPTEAQWEYAARSRGKAVAHATNNGKEERGVNIRNPVHNQEMPVGSWPPNPLGVYDMTGNANEWTVDNAHPYRREPLVNPRYDEYIEKKPKATRGFGIIGSMGGIQLYKRIWAAPENTGAGNGIRCVVNHPEPLPQTLNE